MAKLNVKRISETEFQVYFDSKYRGLIRVNRYITTRNKEHFVKKYLGFGISKEIFDYLENVGVREIVIIYTKVDNTQEVYYSDLETWRKHGILDSLGGFEEQIFLETKKMSDSNE